MAKFNEYPVKATPEDADTLMLYDAASKANKLSPFSGIWNWMVNKLTNAVINNLQTSNKTVVGALNELNSNPKIENSINIVRYIDIIKANEYVYTGIEITVPANTVIIVQVEAGYNNSEPIGVAISKSKESCNISSVVNSIEKYPTILMHVFDAVSVQASYYVWAKYKAVAKNKIIMNGISIK